MTTSATNPPALNARIGLALGDIKLAHSVFALPFALLGAMLARPTMDSAARTLGQLALVVVCMVCARTWAMLVNRLVDARFDALNPRTTRRALASGRLAARDGWAMALAAAAAFMLACVGFWVVFANPWPALLTLPTLAWIALYSLTKRFTALCHVFLGGALAVSPLAAAIAMHPASLGEAPALWWIAGMVVCWVAGFDIIYALADLDFDRAAGLHSIPARLGRTGAAWASRALHLAAVACLVAAALAETRFGLVFALGVALAAALLLAEHIVLKRKGLAGLDMAFFTLNGVVSIVLGALGVIDLTIA